MAARIYSQMLYQLSYDRLTAPSPGCVGMHVLCVPRPAVALSSVWAVLLLMVSLACVKALCASRKRHRALPSVVNVHSTRDGTRTRNLLLRREAPYPLGHTSNVTYFVVRHRVGATVYLCDSGGYVRRV